MAVSGSGLSGSSASAGVLSRSYNFSSFSGSFGTEYIAGFYNLSAADLNLSQASATGTHGAANVPYAAHALLVAADAGTASGGATGTAKITVSGTSINDAGTRTTGDSEIIVADVTAMSTNEYFETAKKWLGQVTYTIAATGDHTTFAADFNVGFAKYEDFGNRNFRIDTFESVGLAGAADGSFDVALLKHSASNWVYHATAFVAPTANDIVRASTVHSTENDVDSGVEFAFKRTDLNTQILGTLNVPTTSSPNGVMIQVVTGANGAVQNMNCHIGVTLT